MTPLTWEVIARLVIEIGLPATNYIVKQWQEKGEVTPETWAEAYRLASQTAMDRTLAVISAAKLNPDDPFVKQVVELVGSAK